MMLYLSIVTRKSVQTCDTSPVIFFLFFLLFIWRSLFFRVFLVPFPLSLCIGVRPFLPNCVFLLIPCDHGLDFFCQLMLLLLLLLCENPINQSTNVCGNVNHLYYSEKSERICCCCCCCLHIKNRSDLYPVPFSFLLFKAKKRISVVTR